MKRTRLWKYVSFIIMTGITSFTSVPVHAAGMSTECVKPTVNGDPAAYAGQTSDQTQHKDGWRSLSG
ncbi:MAG: hypothetical protein K2O13_04005 [Lachnospiraceae bacterium]|nr:hypothetical protein [Lachnospiraceae bacterium]